MVAIISDGGLDLSPELIRRYCIRLVPMRIMVDGREVENGHQLPPDQRVTTSQPSPQKFVDAINGEEAVIITLSKNVSGSYQSAMVASSLCDGVEVIDSNSASGGQGLLVLGAARLAAAGKTREEIVQWASGVIPEIRLIALAERLSAALRSGRAISLGKMLIEHEREEKNEKNEEEEDEGKEKVPGYLGLLRGRGVDLGRGAMAKLADVNMDDLERRSRKIGAVMAILERALRIKYFGWVKGGHVMRGGVSMGFHRAVRKAAQIVLEDVGDQPIQMLVSGAAAPGRMAAINRVVGEFNYQELVEAPLSTAIGIYTGPGAMIIAYCPEEYLCRCL